MRLSPLWDLLFGMFVAGRLDVCQQISSGCGPHQRSCVFAPPRWGKIQSAIAPATPLNLYPSSFRFIGGLWRQSPRLCEPGDGILTGLQPGGAVMV